MHLHQRPDEERRILVFITELRQIVTITWEVKP
jgi:hypothetical protein